MLASDAGPAVTVPSESIREPVSSQTYVEHGAVEIDGDSDFLSTAASEGWPGSGSSGDPIVISGYRFFATLVQPVRIWNTGIHWIFEENLVTTGGVICGVWIDHTTAGIIRNNTFDTCHSGMVLYNTANILVENNTFVGNAGNGIESQSLSDSVIRFNEFIDLGNDGMVYDETTNVRITDNIIDNMSFVGINMKKGGNTTIENNEIRNCRTGFRLGRVASGIVFRNNVIRDITNNGIVCYGDSNEISNNIIRNVGENGITFSMSLDMYPEDNSLIDNTFINSTEFAVEIKANCTGNIVTGNDFFDTGNSCHICDHADDSVIEGNFYDTWALPDADENEIVDKPYPILGSAANSDPAPRALPNNAIPDDYEYVPQSPTTPGEEFPLGTIALVGGIGIVVCVAIVVFVKQRG